MSYGLDAFSADLHRILKTQGLAGLPEIAEKLKGLLVDPGFVAATCAAAPVPQRELYHDADSDAYVLAHVQEAGKSGRPHSHGASWAVYGNVRGTTEMTEWRRVNPESEDHVVLEVDRALPARAGTDARLWAGGDPLDRPSSRRAGDPGDRHRSQHHPALSLPAEEGQDPAIRYGLKRLSMRRLGSSEPASGRGNRS